MKRLGVFKKELLKTTFTQVPPVPPIRRKEKASF